MAGPDDVPLDPHRHALATVEDLLARGGRLRAEQCLRLAELAPMVPGRLRAIAGRLSEQRDAAAVEGLLLLPRAVPGVVEGLYGALSAGVSRRHMDGAFASRGLAVEFRRSRARAFPQLLARAHAALPASFVALQIGARVHYRVELREGPGTLAGRVAAVSGELQWLYDRLARLAGTRLWINGWCLGEGPAHAAVGRHLLRAFLAWAGRQVATRPPDEPRP